jgi:hypothetical protein
MLSDGCCAIDGMCSSSVIKIVKMKYNRINIKCWLVSTSFKIYLDILSYMYITFTIFYYNTIQTIFIILFFSFWTVDREKKILDRQQIVSQWGLQLIVRMHNSDTTPQGVENRNILLWFKCVLINCITCKLYDSLW